MAKCKSCGAEIAWKKTPSGKNMPVDATPVEYWALPLATGKIVTEDGIVVSCRLTGEPGTATGKGYTPHWATCPHAGAYRK